MKNHALSVLGFLLLSNSAFANTNEELEQRIQRLEALQVTQQPVSAVDLRISGFVNVVAATTDQSEPAYYRNIGAVRVNETDDEIDFRGLSNAGIQIDAQINDRLSATFQLLGQGATQFEMDYEWAYISYQATDSVKLRGGKLVLPLYMHSQYKNVGYALPWISVPTEVYGSAAANTYEGVDVTYQFSTGNVSHSLNAFYGGLTVELRSGGEVYLDELRGVNLSSRLGNLSTWLSVNRNNYTTTVAATYGAAAYDLDDDLSDFYSIGAQYDNGQLLLMFEANRYEVPKDYYPDFETGYVTAGWRFGKYLPYVTWATADSEGWDDIETTGVPFDLETKQFLYTRQAKVQKSWTFGVRADVTDNLALKAEASRFYNLGEASQQVNAGPLSGTTGSYWDGLAANEDNPMVFRLAANMVF